MHDPDVVVFTIARPWPQRTTFTGGNTARWQIRKHHDHRGADSDFPCKPGCPDNPFPWWRPSSYERFWRLAGRDYYWPALITVWHREPGGADALSVCQRRYQDRHGRWRYSRGWHWHVWHWHLQIHPAQALRRAMLTRCAWCSGRSRKHDPVNISHQWDGPRGRWWQGEPGLFHEDCSSVEHSHGLCFCDVPVLNHGNYGKCVVCSGFRAYRQQPDEADRLLASLPKGSRIPAAMRPQIEAAWAVRRAAREAT